MLRQRTKRKRYLLLLLTLVAALCCVIPVLTLIVLSVKDFWEARSFSKCTRSGVACSSIAIDAPRLVAFLGTNDFLSFSLDDDSHNRDNDDGTLKSDGVPRIQSTDTSPEEYQQQQQHQQSYSWMRIEEVLLQDGSSTAEQHGGRQRPPSPFLKPHELSSLPYNELATHTAQQLTKKVRQILRRVEREMTVGQRQPQPPQVSTSASAFLPYGSIPQRFLHVYKTGALLPRPAVKIITEWRRQYPDMPHIILDDDDCRGLAALFDYAALEEQRAVQSMTTTSTSTAAEPVKYPYRITMTEVWDTLPLGVMRGDLGRLLAVFFIGGLYTDLDVEYKLPFSQWRGGDPFEPLWVPPPINAIRPRDILLGYEYGDTQRSYCNWLFGARPRHPALYVVLHSVLRGDFFKSTSSITNELKESTKNAELVNEFAGPRRLMYGINKYNSLVRKMSRKRELFDYGSDATEAGTLLNITANTYRTVFEPSYKHVVIPLRSNNNLNLLPNYQLLLDNTMTQAVPSMNSDDVSMVNVHHLFASRAWLGVTGYESWLVERQQFLHTENLWD